MPELQLDGLPGPTLIHGGLAQGNLASQANAHATSRPRAGARACLAKMRTVMELGVPQAFLPPLVRPAVEFLQACGYTAQNAPQDLLACANSTAFQWTANAGTVAPASDTRDGIGRIVPANLSALLHRSLEATERQVQLARYVPLTVTAPLPSHPRLGDEGAANHTRVVGPQGICHVFVYGRAGDDPTPTRFIPRQTLTASRAVARLLKLPAERCLFVQQLPQAIDAGAFHNDVVMVGTADHLLLHAQAWVEQSAARAELQRRCGPLRIREIAATEVSLAHAVSCYLFNSQLLETANGWVLVAPAQCAEGPAAAMTQRLLDEGFIQRVILVDVRESMRGGGGPACLRLRLPLTEPELAKIGGGILLNAQRITQLEAWVDAHYRTTLTGAELADPALGRESTRALSALYQLLES